MHIRAFRIIPHPHGNSYYESIIGAFFYVAHPSLSNYLASFVPILLWCFVQTFVIFVKNFQRKYSTKGKCHRNVGWGKTFYNIISCQTLTLIEFHPPSHYINNLFDHTFGLFSSPPLPLRARLILRAFQTENRNSSFEIDTLLRIISAFANYCFWKFDNVHCCQSCHFLSKLALPLC